MIKSEESKNLLKLNLNREFPEFRRHPDGDLVLSRTLDVVVNAINGVGEFQQKNVDRFADIMIKSLEGKMNSAVDQITDEVKNLEEKIGNLPAIITPSKD